jgi:hypothetical protein
MLFYENNATFLAAEIKQVNHLWNLKLPLKDEKIHFIATLLSKFEVKQSMIV